MESWNNAGAEGSCIKVMSVHGCPQVQMCLPHLLLPAQSQYAHLGIQLPVQYLLRPPVPETIRAVAEKLRPPQQQAQNPLQKGDECTLLNLRKRRPQPTVCPSPKMLLVGGKCTTQTALLSAWSELATGPRAAEPRSLCSRSKSRGREFPQRKWLTQGVSLWYGMRQAKSVLITTTSSNVDAPPTPSFSPGPRLWSHKVNLWAEHSAGSCQTSRNACSSSGVPSSKFSKCVTTPALRGEMWKTSPPPLFYHWRHKKIHHLPVNQYCKLPEAGNQSRVLPLELSHQALPGLPSLCAAASWGAESGSSWAVVAPVPACHLNGTARKRHMAQCCSATERPTYFSLELPVTRMCKMSGLNEMISETLPISNWYF